MINNFKQSSDFFFKILLLLLIITAGGIYFSTNSVNPKNIISEKPAKKSPEAASEGSVLGSDIFISGSRDGYSMGGMLALSSTDEPAINIAGYDISGDAEIKMYKADERAVLDYLTHDSSGNQTKKEPNVSNFQFVTTVKQSISSNSYKGSKVILPFEETGVWYLKVKIKSIDTSAFVVRSNHGLIVNEGDNEFIFWGQNFKNKRSITSGTVKVLNLEDSVKELQSVSVGSDGIAKANLNAQADIALLQQDNDIAIVPINLKYLNSGSSYQNFHEKTRNTRYFIFTDRPLYKPGDTVNFKTILREDDDARYTIPNSQVTVKIFDNFYYGGQDTKVPVFEQSYPVSADGTIDGRYQLPTTAKTGYYTISISNPSDSPATNNWDSDRSPSSISFNVEFYRKPEFSIDVAVSDLEVVAGENASFTINGSYFSGQPMMNQKVKYNVRASDFYEYTYLTDYQNYSKNISNEYQYSYMYGSNKVKEGVATLDKNGQAKIEIPTKMNFNKGKSQVFSIEATIEDGSQNPSFSRRNMLVLAGEYGIYRQDSSYGSKINTPLTLPITLRPYDIDVNVAKTRLQAKIKRTNWVSYQEENKKYPSYRKEEEDLPGLSVTTDNQGNANVTFTPKKIGSYEITVEGKDVRGNTILKEFHSYVSADGQPYYSDGGNNNITLSTDKQKYAPSDAVRFDIFSQIPDRDVFLSLERGRVDRYQVVSMNGKNASVNVPLAATDIPNIYGRVESFSNSSLDSNHVNVPVSADSKKVLVDLTFNSKTYGPGETVNVNIHTTDVNGNPLAAELALWSVDKAIFELSDNKLGNIFDTFWRERSDSTQQAHSLQGISVLMAEMGGGCFAEGTQILMADGKNKNIEDVKVGDYIFTREENDAALVKARVSETRIAKESGYLILNRNLKVTADHILWINDTWQEAGSVEVGDTFVDTKNNKVAVTSVEWQRGAFDVYNLEIEKYHTFFANGIWVHNQKGGERSAFRDTAYWNPSIHTDSAGRAQVSFVLPDNLTTWTVASVASTNDTKVGQTTEEIIVSKDVVVRPILPNIMRTGDEIILSALVQNFTDTDQTFDINLSFDSGKVDEPLRPNIAIKSKDQQQFYWKVRPDKENFTSKLVFSATSKTDPKLNDIITQVIPVKPFGFEEKRAESGEGDKNYQIKLAQDSHKEKSEVTLSLSSSIVGSLPTAMKYLIDYPYGCVEQTTSRFVPAVIAKTNPGLFAQSLKDNDVNDMLEKGVSRLSTLQQNDGGWAWWFSGQSEPFITAYVIEYLLQARQAGIKVDDSMFIRAETYLQEDGYHDAKSKTRKKYDRDDIIAKNYALTLLGEKDALKKNANFEFDNLHPDMLALLVMTNYLNGDTNPKTNGLDSLIAMGTPQGDAIFWSSGLKVNFGSADASTALAIRAILLAGGDRDVAAKGARYLMRVRKHNYWSNTYATSQVIRSMVEFSKTGNELTPNYTYSVFLDNKQIAQGSIINSQQTIQDITIPISSINPNGSSVSIVKSGAGQIYSTLSVNEFHTDRKAKAVDRNLQISREYVNEKGRNYSLGVGDTVNVEIKVDGLKTDENYGVIHDELPSGLVPINESFKNEQYGESYDNYYTSYDITDKEVTENGMIMSLYQIRSGSHTYRYKARVVNEGTFIVPPATASLMYAPEISGRSDVQTVVVGKTSQQLAENGELKKKGLNALIPVGILLFLAAILFLIMRRRKKPPTTPEKPTTSEGFAPQEPVFQPASPQPFTPRPPLAQNEQQPIVQQPSESTDVTHEQN